MKINWKIKLDKKVMGLGLAVGLYRAVSNFPLVYLFSQRLRLNILRVPAVL